jgi:hypothetical protein
MHPGFELCLTWLPSCGVLPDPEEHFLGHIFGLGVISQHSPGEADHPRQVSANDLGRGALIAGADTTHQFFVRIPHGLEANSENRFAARWGEGFNAELLSTFMHPAAAFAER